jgi:hypothetical protein
MDYTGQLLSTQDNARRIYFKMHQQISSIHFHSYTSHDKAKSCALILVDQLIEQWCFIYNETPNNCDYWNEVKQHIKQIY